jgi:hypothetical protein
MDAPFNMWNDMDANNMFNQYNMYKVCFYYPDFSTKIC